MEQALFKFGGADVIHDNGMWLPHNHALAALAIKHDIPRIVSLRGMAEPWALKHRHWKKRIAWLLYQRRDLITARCHHVTSTMEALNLSRLALPTPISMVPNGVDIPDPIFNRSLEADDSAEQHKVALFLSRIHPKKGLRLLIKAWSVVQPRGWRLEIAGPDEVGHRREIEKAVIASGLSSVVSFLGSVAGDQKSRTFARASLFVLPTYSENFGIAVAEALAHGLPVLTTTGAPWPMIAEMRCGWWVEPNVAAIAEALRQATTCDARSLQAMGTRGREYVAAEFNWRSVARSMIALYRDTLMKPRDPRNYGATSSEVYSLSSKSNDSNQSQAVIGSGPTRSLADCEPWIHWRCREALI
jgi:glycosyltransferase involved in cell wall biosynthesis